MTTFSRVVIAGTKLMVLGGHYAVELSAIGDDKYSVQVCGVGPVLSLLRYHEVSNAM